MIQPGFWEAFRVWARIGVLSFGGPAAQIALVHRLLVEERRWLKERDYLNALSFCMLLPGPEAMQLVTYAGWRQHSVLGGLAAGLLFVLPGALVVMGFAAFYLAFGTTPTLETAFIGIKAAVLVIVFDALWRMARRSLKTALHTWIAALSFVGLFVFQIPFPILILAAGLLGFTVLPDQDNGPGEEIQKPRIAISQTLKTIIMWCLIWIVPLVLIAPLTGLPVLADLGLFFSKLATVTFGGAYAVLAYMAQDAVQTHGWLTTPEMIDGLGLAETTPGPLILVTEFVGFLAAARASDAPDFTVGVLGAVVTLWATFAPCFLWIFAGAPYIEWLTAKPRLAMALAGIGAAVVGVILNLSLWFAIHVLFASVQTYHWGYATVQAPQWRSINWMVLPLVLLAAFLLLRMRQSVLVTLLVCGTVPLVVKAVAGFI